VLGQDDYFLLSPRVNDARRRQDVGWLGPHVEIYLPLLEENIIDAINGKKSILRPLIDYDENKILEENVDLTGVEVVIVEGTYTSLLRNAHTRIFIDRDFEETLAHRKERNRGKEVGDPFIEQILATEHKIIAGHKNLANIIITTDYDVIFAEKAV
jgi:uridine kinase